MSINPKVTVLMPVYNVALFIHEAIESILNQTMSDFELLIINDGSSDTTRDEVFKFNDSRIRFVENKQNIGLANTLNRGLELAKGEYIARMDGDDISMPDRIEKQLAVLEKNQDIDICGAGYHFFGTKNYDVIYPQRHDEIKVGLLFGCCMIIPMFRKKSLLDKGLRYNQNFFPAEDYRFWVECMLSDLRMFNIPEILFLYRMHSSQVSVVMTDQQRVSDDIRKFYFKSLFPHFNDSVVNDFIAKFSILTNFKALEDYDLHKKFIDVLVSENKLYHILDNELYYYKLSHVVRYKLTNYLDTNWFKRRYSPCKLLRLLYSGYFCRLTKKNRLKLIVKSILFKRNKNIISEFKT